ncbi:YjfB family protein [Mobilitalea sibirica]|uniref:YjfB family protein n=1 Tax=Mobilitalea sibirica TaxID=1462919 RepID=A0A8J7L3E9_9FIRM|nr:YjfB family protein [Mobilitalea sibirica]MBH1942443.1 YjfB family protein [Mobilitalea sibirica]
MKIQSLPTPILTNKPADIIDVSIAVLGKSLDTIEQAGQNMIKMMEESVQPNLGKNIDYKI